MFISVSPFLIRGKNFFENEKRGFRVFFPFFSSLLLRAKKEGFLRDFCEEALSLFEICPAQQASVAPTLIRLGSPHAVKP
jgi:hypothetical protein